MRDIQLLAIYILIFGLSNAAPIGIHKRTNKYPWVVFPGDPEYHSHDSVWDGGKWTYFDSHKNNTDIVLRGQRVSLATLLGGIEKKWLTIPSNVCDSTSLCCGCCLVGKGEVDM